MTRKEAFDILGLKPGSNTYDVERRYTLLAKRYRGMSDEETLKKIEQITIAYDVLMGRYVPPPPPDPRDEKVILGKKRKEWRNIWAYGKVPFFITLLICIFVGWLIYTIVTNTPPDFHTSVFGDFYQTQGAMNNAPMKLETLIREQNEDLQKPVLSVNIIADRPGLDPQLLMGSQMKMTLMMTGADKVDLLILDQTQYERMVPEGILLPLDDVLAKLEKEHPDVVKKFIKPLRTTLTPDVLPEGEKPAEHIYGLDLSEKQLLNSLDLTGRTQVLALCYHSQHQEKAREVMYKLLASADQWYNPAVPILTERRSEETAASGPAVPAATTAP